GPPRAAKWLPYRVARRTGDESRLGPAVEISEYVHVRPPFREYANSSPLASLPFVNVNPTKSWLPSFVDPGIAMSGPGPLHEQVVTDGPVSTTASESGTATVVIG